jgi:hypothetical protein
MNVVRGRYPAAYFAPSRFTLIGSFWLESLPIAVTVIESPFYSSGTFAK